MPDVNQNYAPRGLRIDWSLFWLRWLAAFLLLFAAPATASVVQERVGVERGEECYSDSEGESSAHDSDECLGWCMHCRGSLASAVSERGGHRFARPSSLKSERLRGSRRECCLQDIALRRFDHHRCCHLMSSEVA